MSDLIIIGYDDEETAEKAFAEVERLQKDLLLELDAAAVVHRREDGKLKVETPHEHAGLAGGALWGVLFGTLFGLIFFIPIIGLVTGGVLGALFGAMDDAGIDASFRDRVRDVLQPGKSALVMVVEKATPDKVVEALSRYGGTVLQTSLSHDAEDKLREALAGAQS